PGRPDRGRLPGHRRPHHRQGERGPGPEVSVSPLFWKSSGKGFYMSGSRPGIRKSAGPAVSWEGWISGRIPSILLVPTGVSWYTKENALHERRRESEQDRTAGPLRPKRGGADPAGPGAGQAGAGPEPGRPRPHPLPDPGGAGLRRRSAYRLGKSPVRRLRGL